MNQKRKRGRCPVKTNQIKWLLMLAVLAVSGFAALNPLLSPSHPAQSYMTSDVLLLDPGHGGIDGGAVSLSGTCEKDINLAIALQVKSMAEADGWEVLLTRESDKGLYTGVKKDGTENAEIKNGRSIRSLKTEDLKARKELLGKINPRAAVSIHLNSFREDRSVHGSQTFYPSSSSDPNISRESRKLAECIQSKLEQGIPDGRTREAMGKSDVLILKDPPAPIVIVECGFLSNEKEAKLLQQEDYQKSLAECIYRGIMTYTGKKPRPSLFITDSRG